MGEAVRPTTRNGDKHMKTTDKYVGLDVHKDTTVIAVANDGREGEVRLYGSISSDLKALENVLRKLGGEGVCLHVVYEAGPTGFVLCRRLKQTGDRLHRGRAVEDATVEGTPAEDRPAGRDPAGPAAPSRGTDRHPRARRGGRVDPRSDPGPG